MEATLKHIEIAFNGAGLTRQREGLVFVTVPKEIAVEAVTWLRDYAGFRHLVLVSAVDWIERGVFQLTYLLHSEEAQADIGIRVEIDREEATMYSIHHLWAQAHVYQRELKEMFGIDFPGSPRLNEPFVLEGWNEIPPMRRDFDTKKYSEETYFPREGRSTVDPSERMARERYPNEEKIKGAIKRLVREKESD